MTAVWLLPIGSRRRVTAGTAVSIDLLISARPEIGGASAPRSPVVFLPRDRFRVPPRRPARRRRARRDRAAGRGAVSGPARPRGRRPRVRSGRAQVLDRPRGGAGALRRAGASRRGLRLVAAGSQEVLGAGRESRDRERRPDDGRGRRGRATHRPGHALGGGGRARERSCRRPTPPRRWRS